MIHRLSIVLLSIVILYGCKSDHVNEDKDLFHMDWDDIVSSAKGQTVTFMMWQGSPKINAYISDYIAQSLKDSFDITLRVVSGQGPEIVQHIMGEKEASIDKGLVDIVWINGETFYHLNQIKGLWGPFVNRLPNSQYIDFEDRFIGIDFQRPIEGMEAPWSVTQFVLLADTLLVPNPPSNLDELSAFVKANPGSFTITNDFTGMTLLKSFLAELGGSPSSLNGPFDEKKYTAISTKLWQWINDHKVYFWKEGKTFPKEHTRLKQLVGSGELKIGYGFGEGGIDDAISQGLYTLSTRAYTWDNGTIKNSNYLGIVYNAPQKAAAMVAINFMMSPKAQMMKADPLGMDAYSVLDMSRLPESLQKEWQQRPLRQYGPSLEELSGFAIQEPDPRYMIRLFDDFRKYVIEQ